MRKLWESTHPRRSLHVGCSPPGAAVLYVCSRSMKRILLLLPEIIELTVQLAAFLLVHTWVRLAALFQPPASSEAHLTHAQ
jgi:hypothetical protein